MPAKKHIASTWSGTGSDETGGKLSHAESKHQVADQSGAALAAQTCLQHEAYSALKAHVFAQHGDPLKVGIHIHLGPGVGIQLPPNGAHQLGQALQVLLLGRFHISQQLLNALVHDLLRQHLLAVKVADELDVTQCPLPCLNTTKLFSTNSKIEWAEF